MSDDPQTHWWQGRCVCSICGYVQYSVIEIDAGFQEPAVPLECGGCGNMTAQPEHGG